MSMENVKLLFDSLVNNENLQKQLKDLRHKKNEEMINEIIKLGEKQGIQFTREEFYEYIAKATRQSQNEDDLSDEELQGVAGGLSGWIATSVVTCPSSMLMKVIYQGDYTCIADKDVVIPGIPGL